MTKIKNVLARLAVEEDGATAVEYALIAALVAAVIVLAVTTLGNKTSGNFNTVEGAMP